MLIEAPSLRRGLGISDPELWTDMLLSNIDHLIRLTAQGDASARRQLEAELLHAQQVAYHNPFVSCSHQWGIAQSFALADGTPGYLLTIEGEQDDGVDFHELRQQYGLFGDAVDALQEFGIRRQLDVLFNVAQVDLVAPYGQPPQRVMP